MLDRFKQEGDMKMVRKLEEAPVTLGNGTPEGYLALRDKAMHALGIGTTHDMKSVVSGIFIPSWLAREYTLKEKVDLWRGRSFSRKFGLWDKLLLYRSHYCGANARASRLFLPRPIRLHLLLRPGETVFPSARCAFEGVLHVRALSPLSRARRSRKARSILRQDVLAGSTSLADAT